MKNEQVESSKFHDLAWPFLVKQGFQLINDPNETFGPYRGCAVLYKTSKGFYLHIGFESIDGHYVNVSCGRLWKEQNSSWFRLSNHLHFLAKEMSLDFPINFKIYRDKNIKNVISNISEEIKKVLPTVLKNVSIELLAKIEKQKYGAKVLAELRSNKNKSSIKVSKFIC